MKKIGIFGGAFDPPHLGHMACVVNAINSGLVDEVIIVPSGASRYDKNSMFSPEERYKMLYATIHDSLVGLPVEISRVQIDEILKEGSTYELVSYYKNLFSGSEIKIMIGTELVGDLPTWKNSEKLLKEYSFLVFPRIGFEYKPVEGNFEVLDAADCFCYSYSSRQIRQKIKDGQLVYSAMTPSAVEILKKH